MWTKTDKRKALKIVRAIASGERGTGRNAMTKLAAAKMILADGEVLLTSASDAELLAEVSKRGLQVATVDLDAAERAMDEHG